MARRWKAGDSQAKIAGAIGCHQAYHRDQNPRSNGHVVEGEKTRREESRKLESGGRDRDWRRVS